jgi:hypothetical protein
MSAAASQLMKDLGRPPSVSARSRVLRLLAAEFEDSKSAHDLFAEFLSHTSFNKGLCLKLLAAARYQNHSWEIRRLAILMLEHQTLKIHPDNVDEFNFLFRQLNLKKSLGANAGVVSSVLQEGYSTTRLRDFISEFRRRLQRLNRIHKPINGWKTSDAALSGFIDASRRDCRLTLARYLFTAEEVVDEIVRQVMVTDGARDFNNLQPLFVAAEAERAFSRLPEFEATILKKLSASSQIYWVSEATSSEINSLVEYPLTTVVLVIKPPGSDVEFEIKRAGQRDQFSLKVIHARDGWEVAPSHRLDGGSMLWMLRHEANAGSRLALIYRLVHGDEAPLPTYISRSTVYSIPLRDGQVQTLTYFTEPAVFGDSFPEMRQAMSAVVNSFTAEGYMKMPELLGDLGLTAQFISTVCPGQTILKGTSSFRVDKLAAYLSGDGARLYFEQGLNCEYSIEAAQRFADALLEEVLGVYHPPRVKTRSYRQYLAAAFAVLENRAQADANYQAILEEIGKTWGTLMGVKGYTRGESFVARNVGLRTVWDRGQWRVKIIFMDHDTVVIPGPGETDFHAPDAIPCMAMDEVYLWSRPGCSILGTVGHLRSIYRVSDDTHERAMVLARIALQRAYQKTQGELKRNPRLQALFEPTFVEKLTDWNRLVRSYLRMPNEEAAVLKWINKQRNALRKKGYQDHEIDDYFHALESNRAFLERQSDIF